MSTHNSAMAYKPTFRERVGHKLFPRQMPTHTDPHFEVRDFIRSNVVIEISFLDRLRLLLSGRAICEVRTQTENPVGKCVADGHFTVEPFRWLQR